MSVNGKTGKVTITKEDVGLGYVLNLNTLPLGLNIAYGMNFNNQLEAGIADYMGTPSAPSQNAPISASNPSQEDGYWALLTLGRVPYGVTQVAFSLRADRAIRIRSYLHSEKFWMPWAEVFN